MIAEATNAYDTGKGAKKQGTQLEYLHNMNKINPEKLSSGDIFSQLTANL